MMKTDDEIKRIIYGRCSYCRGLGEAVAIETNTIGTLELCFPCVRRVFACLGEMHAGGSCFPANRGPRYQPPPRVLTIAGVDIPVCDGENGRCELYAGHRTPHRVGENAALENFALRGFSEADGQCPFCKRGAYIGHHDFCVLYRASDP